MRILLASHFFAPSVGGTEIVGGILADAWAAAGHAVRVVTVTPAGPAAAASGGVLPYEVVRRPTAGRLLGLVRWCDVFFQNNVSLRTAWPLLVVRRPWVVTHHSRLERPDGRRGWQDRLKRRLLRRAINIAVSEALAGELRLSARVIGNPYRAEMFRPDPAVTPDRDLLFVGRLVSQKGVDLLVDALAQLAAKGIRPTVTVAGEGPEEGRVRAALAAAGLLDRVALVGLLAPAALAAMYRRHRLVVVPSRVIEPFGLTALEGVACGCVAVVPDVGGLPAAAGPCGVTFRHGDAGSLAAVLGRLLAQPIGSTAGRNLRAGTEEHLRQHRPEAVARRYLEVFAAAVEGARR